MPKPEKRDVFSLVVHIHEAASHEHVVTGPEFNRRSVFFFQEELAPQEECLVRRISNRQRHHSDVIATLAKDPVARIELDKRHAPVAGVQSDDREAIPNGNVPVRHSVVMPEQIISWHGHEKPRTTGIRANASILHALVEVEDAACETRMNAWHARINPSSVLKSLRRIGNNRNFIEPQTQ